MNQKAKLKTDLGASSEPVFSDEVTIIINTTTKYVSAFTGLPLDMTTVVKPALKNFNDARLAPVYEGQEAEVKDFRTVVQKMITKDGNWLNTFCDGNTALLKKTGYPLQKESEAQGKLEATILTVNTVPNSALIEFFISHIKGSGIHYGIMLTPFDNEETDQSQWTYYYASQREGQIPKLLPNTKYKLVSFAMGTDNNLTYSDEVVITTLK